MVTAPALAITQMQHEAKQLGAADIVGVQLQEHQHGWDGRAIELLAVGTAIKRNTPATKLEPPATVLDLNDRH